MSTVKLDQAFLTGAVATTNFFNGRLLSAEDLRREQEAVRIAQERLGIAIGSGIVAGFEVEAQAIGGSSDEFPVVIVKPGLAIAENGEMIALDRQVEVSLTDPSRAASSPVPSTNTFRACADGTTATVYIAGEGVYLLAAAPAEGTRGLAMVNGLGNRGSTCNAKEKLTGVMFKMVQVSLSDTELDNEVRLRNLVAYKFFAADGAGTEGTRDPLGPAPAATVLTDQPLTDCDVPLALIYWTRSGGIRWVDLWSVRRIAERRESDVFGRTRRPISGLGRAMSLQFRDNLKWAAETSETPLVASTAFLTLPPVGIVPVDSKLGVGFFSGQTYFGPTYVEGARLGAAFARAFEYAPIVLSTQEAIWLYLVRQNRETSGPVPYVVFATGHAPYEANARFDLSRWDFANIALTDDPDRS